MAIHPGPGDALLPLHFVGVLELEPQHNCLSCLDPASRLDSHRERALVLHPVRHRRESQAWRKLVRTGSADAVKLVRARTADADRAAGRAKALHILEDD
eukprot:532279-Rhodomonas_salina.1